ncbi:MAG: CDP-diacylglycerol--serine O-phosphatidyltransferase [Spirochaetota bacterium]
MTLVWIPNSLTLGNLLFGFISLIFSSLGTQQGYFIAGFLILAAGLLDGLDGPAARALKVSSPLGKELDSLADCVAFGIAPGFLSYNSYLTGIHNSFFSFPIDLGMLIAAVFPVCAAYRLARFNILSDSSSFVGLPAPAAGIIIALFHVYNIEMPKLLFAVIFIALGLLMVSTVRYSKPKSSYIFENIHGIKLIIFAVIIILIVIFFKKWTVFIFISFYILSGLLSFVIQFIQEHKY